MKWILKKIMDYYRLETYQPRSNIRIWFKSYKFDGDDFLGIIDNEPVLFLHLNENDRIIDKTQQYEGQTPAELFDEWVQEHDRGDHISE